ncbi:conjugal transfer protein TrbL family protein [Staphylococcus gallinarum]|uniref:conjugal transfer protein TrbL family protein n=1 Tax=Staphylococcus gallinarum TaxID=1293 RepID=UPI003F57081A
MKYIKKVTVLLILFLLICPSFAKLTMAAEQGTGVKNDLSNTSQKAYNTLPSDAELEKKVENQNANIADSSNTKKIGEGKKALYKAYKDEIDKEVERRKKNKIPHAEDLRDNAKAYDTTTGKLKVGTFDVEGHVNNMFLSAGKFLVKSSTEPLKEFTIKPSDVLDAPSAKPMKNAFNSLTDVLLALFLIFQLTKILISRAVDIGYNGQQIYDKIFKTFVATILIGLYEPIFKLILDFQYLLVTPILHSINVNDNMAGIIALRGMIVDSMGMMIILPLTGVLLVVVTLSLFYSLAMLIILFIIGPIAITTMVNDEMDFYSLWIRRVISRVLTLMLQSLCIAMCFATLFRVTFNSTETMTDVMLGLAFLFVALAIPKMLENFGDSSGAGRSTLMFIRSVGRKK